MDKKKYIYILFHGSDISTGSKTETPACELRELTVSDK